MTQASEISEHKGVAQALRRLFVMAALPLLALVIPLGYLAYQPELDASSRNAALLAALACLALLSIVWFGCSSVRRLALQGASMARTNESGALREHDLRYRAVVDASRDGFWVVDAQGRLREVNDAYVRRSGYAREELLGMSVTDVEACEGPQEVAAHIDEILRKGVDVFESLHRAKDGSLWPVEIVATARSDRPGELLTFVRDISERKRAESLLRTRLKMAELGQQGRMDDLLQVALDAAEEITGSKIGFFHFVDSDQENLRLQAWSTNTLARMCTAEGKGSHYAISAAGVWVDCFHAREPVIHNDYAALPHKKGLPPGHAPVRRELVVPILRGGKVTEIMGVGNKATDYVQSDVEAVQTIAGMAQDLVERMRAEAALKSSEEQQRALLAALPEGVVTLYKGRIEYVNDAMLRMLGLADAGAMEGCKLEDFAPAARRESLVQALGAAQQPRAALLTKLAHSDGSALDVELTIANLAQEPGTRIVVARDVGARLADEIRIQRLTHLYAALSQCNQAVLHCENEKQLFERICAAIVAHGGMSLAWVGRIDPQSRLLVPVARYGDDTGYLNGIQVSTEPDVPTGRGPGGTCVREQRPVWCQDFMNDPSTGPWRARAAKAGWNSIAAVPLRQEGEVIGALSMYSPDMEAFDESVQALILEMAANISFALTHFAHEAERARLEEIHRQAQKLESLGTLAGGIAHDFNNILAAIRGNADLAVQDLGAGHAASESLEEIRIASMRAHDLVRRIMAFARPNESKDEVVDLSAVVDEVLKLLRSALRTSIELKKEFAPDTPRVRADAGQLHETVVNLTTNAAYAIGMRAGTIEYRLEPVQVDEKLAHSVVGLKPGLYTRLSVCDDGCGMDAATLERIFDVFYTTKPVGEGTGLGLSMVHGTMRSHGGAVAVQSVPGQGSRFDLYFPAAREERSDEALLPKAASAKPLAGKRILYVDDEEALILLAQRILTRMGHQVVVYSDAEEALAALRARPDAYDAVVTDLSMPHMSGFDLAREVLALRPDLPVLMTTGYISAEDESNARALGIREVVLKPVTMDELGQLLDKLLRETV